VVYEEPALVVGKAYDLCMWLLPKVEKKIPRSYKFTIAVAFGESNEPGIRVGPAQSAD
jgi:hypothetical protein